MLTATRERSALTFHLVSEPGALVPVEVGRRVQQRLEDALANIAKLEDALRQADTNRYLARTNAFQRFLAAGPVTRTLALVAAPAALAIGPLAAALGTFEAALLATAYTAAPAAMGLTVYADAQEKKRFGGPGLTTDQIACVVSLIAEMSPGDRASVKDFTEQLVRLRLESGRMSPAAGEALLARLANEGAGKSKELLAGRAARLVRELETGRTDTWRRGLAGVLRDHPAAEQRELAGTLLEHFFTDEQCTLPIDPTEAASLYRLLREAAVEQSAPAWTPGSTPSSGTSPQTHATY